MREINSILNLCLLICVLLLIVGCNQSFEPLQKNDKYHFSIYGYLDAAADTQWVRVGVPRESINELPDPTQINVTLEHVEKGQSVVMRDTLIASGELLNFWTTTPIENEQTYRIHVKHNDGKSSMVTVTIPEELPTPLVTYNNFRPVGYNIYIDDSVEIADLQSKWYVLLYPQTERIKKIYTFTYRNSIIHVPTYGGAWYAFANTTEEREYIENINFNAEMVILHRQFFIAAGGPEWIDDISSIDDLEYFLDGTASNVENGLGYVVGIDSKWMPYEACVLPDSSNFTPCEPEEPFW